MPRGDQIIIRRALRRPLRYQQQRNPRYSVRPPLDPLTYEYWDAELGIVTVGGAVDTWTGQKLGIVLTAPSAPARPAYVTDSNFNNGPVVQCATAGSKCVANTAVTAIPSTSRPYSISCVRLSSTPPGATWAIFGLGVVAVADPHYVLYRNAGSALAWAFSGGSLSATLVADTAVHTIEAWNDGTNANCRDNGTLFQTPNISALGNNCTSIGVGRAASTNTHFSDSRHVFHMLCTAKPSESYIASLRAWLTARKGAP